jgi:AraC-like DNA-binding protein
MPKRFLPFSSPRTAHCFIYALRGKCLFTLRDGSCFSVGPEDLIYLSVGMDYSMDIQTDFFDYLICNFDADCEEVCRCFSLPIKTTQEVERVFRRLNRSFSVSDDARELLCLADINRLYALIVQNSAVAYVPGSTRAKIEEARVYIQTHLTDVNLRVADLAEQAGVSDAYFRKLFWDCYGLSPLRFLVNERISCAKKLLELENLPLADVAAQTGFASLPYFCKVFKSQTGMTPAKYRKQYIG